MGKIEGIFSPLQLLYVLFWTITIKCNSYEGQYREQQDRRWKKSFLGIPNPYTLEHCTISNRYPGTLLGAQHPVSYPTPLTGGLQHCWWLCGSNCCNRAHCQGEKIRCDSCPIVSGCLELHIADFLLFLCVYPPLNNVPPSKEVIPSSG